MTPFEMAQALKAGGVPVGPNITAQLTPAELAQLGLAAPPPVVCQPGMQTIGQSYLDVTAPNHPAIGTPTASGSFAISLPNGTLNVPATSNVASVVIASDGGVYLTTAPAAQVTQAGGPNVTFSSDPAAIGTTFRPPPGSTSGPYGYVPNPPADAPAPPAGAIDPVQLPQVQRGPGFVRPTRPAVRPPNPCPNAPRPQGGPFLGGLPFIVGEDLYNQYAPSLGLPKPRPLGDVLAQPVLDLLGAVQQQALAGNLPTLGTLFTPTGPNVSTRPPDAAAALGSLGPGIVSPFTQQGAVHPARPGTFFNPARPAPRDDLGRFLGGRQAASPFAPANGTPTGPVSNPFGMQPPAWTQQPPTYTYPLIITPDSPLWVEVGPPWNYPGPVPGNPCDWGSPCMPDPPPRPPQPQPRPPVTSGVDAAGCGLPTPAVARVYTTTVSGVTNVTCSACNGFNQAWTLSFADRNRGSGVSDCGWDSNDPPGLCTPVGPYGNAELRYQNAGSYELLFKGSGGSNQATYTCAGGSFNGLGPSTFTRTTPAAAAGCDNWPGSLTVSPA